MVHKSKLRKMFYNAFNSRTSVENTNGQEALGNVPLGKGTLTFYASCSLKYNTVILLY